jgi:hypothetical protein
MGPEIRTHDGQHPFDPAHAAPSTGGPKQDHPVAVRVAGLMGAGRCPRCEGPLTAEGAPAPSWRPQRSPGPAGSSATPCRCIPVCGICHDAEMARGKAGELILWGCKKNPKVRIPKEKLDDYVIAVERIYHGAVTRCWEWPVDRRS